MDASAINNTKLIEEATEMQKRVPGFVGSRDWYTI